MSETFQPFAPAGPARKPESFASFAAGVVASAAVQSGQPLPVAAAAHVAGNCAEPVVTLQRTGDLVTSIRIECPCGQVIDLACKY